MFLVTILHVWMVHASDVSFWSVSTACLWSDRFYTGLAMLEQDSDPENKVEAALYLHQGLEHFITLSCNADGLTR